MPVGSSEGQTTVTPIGAPACSRSRARHSEKATTACLLAQAVAREIEAQGDQALAAPADITQADQVQGLVDAAMRHFDAPVQILVNNAGIIPERREKGGRTPAFVDMPVADWAKIVNLNVYGTFHC